MSEDTFQHIGDLVARLKRQVEGAYRRGDEFEAALSNDELTAAERQAKAALRHQERTGN